MSRRSFTRACRRRAFTLSWKPVPSFDPEAVGRQAPAAFDTNMDATTAGAELEKFPGLKASLAAFELDGDGRLNAAEVCARAVIKGLASRVFARTGRAHGQRPAGPRSDGHSRAQENHPSRDCPRARHRGAWRSLLADDQRRATGASGWQRVC
jgi:hypothetical protein